MELPCYVELTIVVDAIRSSFPRGTAIIWYNEAAVFDIANWPNIHDSCGNPISDYSLSALSSLDWFSVDIYHMDGFIPGWVDSTPRAWYERNIFPNMSFPTQSAFLVPGSFGSNVNHYPNGTYICDNRCYSVMISIDAVDYFKWALADERVGIVMPWNWNGCPACNGSRFTPPNTCCMDEIGTKDMPLEISTWESLASALLQPAAAGSTRAEALARVLDVEKKLMKTLQEQYPEELVRYKGRSSSGGRGGSVSMDDAWTAHGGQVRVLSVKKDGEARRVVEEDVELLLG